MAKSGKIYKIKIADTAADFIRKQTKKNQRQIMNKISFLTQDPCGKANRIKSKPEFFNIRSGIFRIAYTVKEKQVIVLVLRIGHRKDFYRYFER
ncbi:MAG: type II toxin-antitoxin system RelE/ParE family toxin [Planctomycetes bacterium]|nr:type II toxin-antitoxin system RelE/ParE family toxin [Planctomycetota bacterium]MBL7145394.1 type II toxin-antitoxin system RelE/ParE family toxin [Phycisphaerae bacterium]